MHSGAGVVPRSGAQGAPWGVRGRVTMGMYLSGGGVPVWGETGTCGEIVCGGVPEQGRFLRERAYG